jgi:hypothetical protein
MNEPMLPVAIEQLYLGRQLGDLVSGFSAEPLNEPLEMRQQSLGRKSPRRACNIASASASGSLGR